MKEFKEFEKVIVLHDEIWTPGLYQAFNEKSNKHIVGFLEFDDNEIMQYNKTDSINSESLNNSNVIEERSFFKPGNGQVFFRVHSDGNAVRDIYDSNSYVYKSYLKIGNCFETLDEAMLYSYEFKKLLERKL